MSEKLSHFIYNQQYDKVIIVAWSEIINNLFLTSFSYTICQRRYNLNTKHYQSHICRFSFNFFIAISYI